MIGTHLPTRRRAVPLLGLMAILCLLGACMPLVTHGPRVEEGIWTGSTGSFRLGSMLEEEVEVLGSSYAVRPPNGFFARYGWQREDQGPAAVLVGLHLPFLIPFSIAHPELDVYAQLTPVAERAYAAGAGVLASPSHLMPYAQAGGTWTEQASWYTTQGLALHGWAGNGPRAVLWTPALTWRRGRLEQSALLRRQSASHYFIQGGFGREWIAEEGAPRSHRRVRFLLLGITTEASGLPSLPRFDIPGRQP
ncbi:hypothetical protein BH23GEM6_BH23GEM6_00780 [soil metagenome]